MGTEWVNGEETCMSVHQQLGFNCLTAIQELKGKKEVFVGTKEILAALWEQIKLSIKKNPKQPKRQPFPPPKK